MKKVINKEIEINIKGKTKEELRAQAMKEIEKQLNDALKDVKEPKNKEEELAKLHIYIDEDPKREGYGCETTIEGSVNDVLDMTACAMATMAQQISQGIEGNISPVGVIPEIMKRTVSLLLNEGKDE